MISILAAALILFQAQAPTQTPPQAQPTDSASLISKMLARYAGASQLSGQLRFTQSAGGKQVVVDTWIQYDRPSKIYLKQVRHSSDPGTFLVTSDGKLFSYDGPPDLAVKPPRLVEAVKAHGKEQTIAEIYHVAGDSLGEQGSPALAIVIGFLPDLKAIRGTWASIETGVPAQVRGVDVTAIKGAYRDSSTQPVSGRYEIDIDKDANLIRYVTEQSFSVPNNPDQSVRVDSVWDVDLKVGSLADPTLFKVIR